MSRSIKKGPYVESALMKRIVEMNKSGKVLYKTKASCLIKEFNSPSQYNGFLVFFLRSCKIGRAHV